MLHNIGRQINNLSYIEEFVYLNKFLYRIAIVLEISYRGGCRIYVKK